MKYTIIPILSALFFFTNCEKAALDDELSNAELPVVQAYLAAGQPIQVFVSQQVPFEQEEASPKALSGLELLLEVESTPYTLTDQGNGLYEGVIAEVGKNYRLSFDYQGQTVSATTSIPTQPIGFKSSANTFTFDTGTFPPSFPDPIELSWENETNDYYQVKIENIESNPVELGFGGGGGERPQFTTLPEQVATYELAARSFQYVGTHRIVLFHVNPEYVTLAQETSSANAQNLTTPYTNIENGTGIFTGVATDTLFIEVRD